MNIGGTKPKKKPRRKYLQPCKHSEANGIDLEKLKMERYFIPVPVETSEGVQKGKLDKKVVEAEDDFTDFYFGKYGWKDIGFNASPTAPTNPYDFKYEYHTSQHYEDRYQQNFPHDEYDI